MPMRAVWAEIDLNALESNIKNIKTCINGNTKWCAVVKADAYGHGALSLLFGSGSSERSYCFA